jgi:hypothetical protein
MMRVKIKHGLQRQQWLSKGLMMRFAHPGNQPQSGK